MNLDLHSLNVMGGLMSTVMGVILLSMRRTYPEQIKGTLQWGLASLVCAMSSFFFGLQHVLPAPLALLTATALLLTGSGAFYFGSQRFYGKASSWQVWAIVGVVGMLALVWFKLVQPDYRWRVVTFSVVLAALVSAHARLIWREGKGFASGFAVMVLASQAAIHIARALISFWMDAPDGNAFKPSPIQAAYLAAFSFSILLGGIGFVLMVSERLREEFEHLAAHDSLTGAMTRRAVLAAGQHEMGRWQRYGRPLSALMLDLDHFKRINDEHGHLAGDRVLIDVVKALREVLRHADVLGRYGGEEFIALLPEADSAAALVTAERLRAAVANACTLGGSAPCTVSIGLASTQPGDAHLDSLLTRADAALYRAKALGRNRVEPG